MKRFFSGCCALFLTGCPGFGTGTGGNGWLTEIPDCPTWEEPVQEMMERYCADCHDSHSFRTDAYSSEDSTESDPSNGVFEKAQDCLNKMEGNASGEQMPPPNNNLPLLDEWEIGTFKRWIENGKPRSAESCDDPTITIFGTVIDLATKTPAPEGLCVAILDPSNGTTVDTIRTLAETTVDASGSFFIDNVPIASEVGLFSSVSNCGSEGEETVYTSRTSISPVTYQSLKSGDALEIKPLSISIELLQILEESLVTAGETAPASENGFMIAWIRDKDGTNLPGATLACDGCGTPYYFDQDASDGLFTSASSLNSVTDEGGRVLLLGPPNATYTATADGFSFEPTVNGGTEGIATCTEFKAQ
jgi:hypothetical protein